jgi:hypothetical protein
MDKKYPEYELLWDQATLFCKLSETKNGLLGSFGIGTRLFIATKPAKDGKYYAKLVPTKLKSEVIEDKGNTHDPEVPF